MKARQNVSRGILSSTLLAEKCPPKKRHNQTFFISARSNDYAPVMTIVRNYGNLDLCDYDYIV